MENSVGNITPNNHIRSAEFMGIGKKDIPIAAWCFNEMKILSTKEVLQEGPGCNEFVARTFADFKAYFP